jgi:DNA-binding CsgD family transcriptional regulator
MMATNPSAVDVDRPVAQVLAEIAHVLVPTDDVEGRLHRALELLRGIVPYEQCALVEAVPDGEPRVRLVPQLAPSEARAMRPALLRLLGLVSELGARKGTVGVDPESTDSETWASYLAVPLVVSDRVDGLLLVCQRVADAYGEDDLRLLSIVAAQIAAYLTTCRRWAQGTPLAEEQPAHPGARSASDMGVRVGLAHAEAVRLTKRQLEVARLISTGRSNAQIARELVLTTGTVANHIEHILRRLGVSNRAQVAAWVVERGLLNHPG